MKRLVTGVLLAAELLWCPAQKAGHEPGRYLLR
jgi:hypothetical protein